MAEIYAAGETVLFTPPGAESGYRLRAPGYLERIRVKRAVTARGGRFVSGAERARVLRQGVRAIHAEAGAEEEGERLVAAIDAYQAEAEARLTELMGGLPGEETSADFPEPPPEIEELQRTVERHYPPYAALKADGDFVEEIMAFEAMRLLLLGPAEGPDYRRDAAGSVAEAEISALPPAHIQALCIRAMQLFQPSEDDKKKSA